MNRIPAAEKLPNAPVPISEPRRLETLRALRILDTDPEEAFDLIERLATEIFSVPIAHVSLIDEHREWFKAKCGTDAVEDERRTAFCAHTILGRGLLVVEDASNDERFRDNPKVVGEPGIRFYAGAPLITRSGLAVGAICVKDLEPRAFSEREGEMLEALARLVVTEMEHRLVEAELRDRNGERPAQPQGELETAPGFEKIIGRSRPMRELFRAVRNVAGTESTVLLTGDTGTGKELIANAIHRLSRRSEGTLVKVNCAALPASLIESELFGHEKGAFTGALTRRLGRFQRAHRGTIFLDEIGDLPLELQAKFLRVLQEGELERVGGNETIRVDVRVVAATNRELATEVEERRFRADLYYRLNVFPVRLPSLRERPEDIPALARHFTAHLSSRIGKHITAIPDEVLDQLVSYPWPGNVRELQNIIERAVILTEGPALQLGGGLPRSVAGASDAASLKLCDHEKRHVLSVLERTGWRVSGRGGAAEVLGLKRTTLEARMKRLGITRARLRA